MQDRTVIDIMQVPIIYIEVFALMLVSFLIGYLFAFYYQKSNYNLDSEALHDHYTDLDADESLIDIPHEEDTGKTTSKKDFSINVQDKKLRERNSDYLDLNRLGYGSALKKDDLQLINGVGPFTEKKLNTIGIYTYGQISGFNEEDIEIVTELIKFFPDRIKNDKWIEQAKKLITQSHTDGRRHDRILKV